MSRPPAIYPRAYLLQVYNEAIAHGFVWVGPVTEDQALSFKMSLYRLRRRSDTSNSSFITPEMHLVTVGEWEPIGEMEAAQYVGPTAMAVLGRIPVLYSSLPEGQSLPTITPASGEELAQMSGLHEAPNYLMQSATPVSFAEADFTIEPADVTDYVSRMMAAAKHKVEEGDD